MYCCWMRHICLCVGVGGWSTHTNHQTPLAQTPTKKLPVLSLSPLRMCRETYPSGCFSSIFLIISSATHTVCLLGTKQGLNSSFVHKSAPSCAAANVSALSVPCPPSWGTIVCCSGVEGLRGNTHNTTNLSSLAGKGHALHHTAGCLVPF